MTPTEIARRRLDAFIEVHGYDFPGFIELSAILFAPENPPTPLNPMNTAEHRLSLALDCLNTLIDQGYEFPEAVYKTLQALAVNRDELVAAYDSQA